MCGGGNKTRWFETKAAVTPPFCLVVQGVAEETEPVVDHSSSIHGSSNSVHGRTADDDDKAQTRNL